MIQDYFSKCTTIDDLNREHRRLVVQMHPDRNHDDPEATAKFQEMQAQYEERKAELNGDYSGSRRARERRERAAREDRERQERDRRQREASRVEHVINEARKNKGVEFHAFKVGDYVYARKAVLCGMYLWIHITGSQLLHSVWKKQVEQETVVKIEAIIEVSDDGFFDNNFCYAMGEEIYGGYEVLQQANPQGGVPKSKRVAKVVMFRSKNYCAFGNPMGDMNAITDYYMPINYEEMFSDKLHQIAAEQEREEQERKRIEAERKAKLLAEQQPMIDEWKGKLITISAALTREEKETVALSNLKKMLRTMFPGTMFKAIKHAGDYELVWEDGPRYEEVNVIERLFESGINLNGLSPWEEQFGHLNIMGESRMMSTLAKASILEQLASVTEAFGTSKLTDDVEVNDFDWMMLHLLVGVDVNNPDTCLCESTNVGNIRKVCVADAIRYIFDLTSYTNDKKTNKQAA